MTKPYTPNKNALIGKIHVAKNQLALADDSYRAVLTRITGKDSSAKMTIPQLEAVLEEFKRLGFKPTGGKRAGTRKKADTAQAAMIRALWLDLYHFGAVKDPSEEALAAFAKRSCGVPALQWVDSYAADAVIKALRGWLERIGFTAPTQSMAKTVAHERYNEGMRDAAHDLYGIAWKIFVVRRQMEMLDIPHNRDTAPHLIDAENLDAAIEKYGRDIRAQKAAAQQ